MAERLLLTLVSIIHPFLYFNQRRCVTEACFRTHGDGGGGTHLCTGLSGAVGTHKLHKLLKGVLMVVVAYGGVGEVGAGLLDDRRGGEVQGRGGGTGTP